MERADARALTPGAFPATVRLTPVPTVERFNPRDVDQAQCASRSAIHFLVGLGSQHRQRSVQ